MKVPVPAGRETRVSKNIVFRGMFGSAVAKRETYQALLTNVGCVFIALSQVLQQNSSHPSYSTGISTDQILQP